MQGLRAGGLDLWWGLQAGVCSTVTTGGHGFKEIVRTRKGVQIIAKASW